MLIASPLSRGAPHRICCRHPRLWLRLLGRLLGLLQAALVAAAVEPAAPRLGEAAHLQPPRAAAAHQAATARLAPREPPTRLAARKQGEAAPGIAPAAAAAVSLRGNGYSSIAAQTLWWQGLEIACCAAFLSVCATPGIMCCTPPSCSFAGSLCTPARRGRVEFLLPVLTCTTAAPRRLPRPLLPCTAAPQLPAHHAAAPARRQAVALHPPRHPHPQGAWCLRRCTLNTPGRCVQGAATQCA